jgi:hypothetical protein
MKGIILPTYNRPHYLKTMLESVRYADNYELFTAIEPSEKLEEIRFLLDSYSRKFKKLHICINTERKGMIQNTFDLMQTALAGVSFCVCLEDDLWLSPDFFCLMDFYERTFREEPLKFSAYGGQSGNYPNPEIDTLISDDYFYGNGWAVFRENWDKWFAPNWFSSEYAQKHFNAMGNDWNISGVFREFNARMLVPTLSRSEHIGVIGQNHNEHIYNRLCKDKVVNTEYVISEFKL